MACDLSALANIDPNDPDQAAALLQQCTATLMDPTLWAWAIGLTVVGGLVGWLIGKRTGAIKRDIILGAALGPLGWIVSLCLPKGTPAPKCAHCGGAVGPGDAHCRHCGTALRA